MKLKPPFLCLIVVFFTPLCVHKPSDSVSLFSMKDEVMFLETLIIFSDVTLLSAILPPT